MSDSEGPRPSDASVTTEPTERPMPSVRTTYHRLRMVGLTAIEAGNLTAHLSGLRVTDQGWTPQEIERLLFLRALVELGRIPS